MSSSLRIAFLAVFLLCNGGRRFNSLLSRRIAYKDGDIVLGGLFDVHHTAYDNGSCTDIRILNLGCTEAMIFAVESINKNKTLLPNVTLGFSIWDYCLRPSLAVATSYELVLKAGNHPFSLKNCPSSNASDGFEKILGVVGPMDSTSAILVSSLFNIAHIPSISPFATSVELSTTLHSNFYRTAVPDNWRSSLLADIAQFFNWRYVAAIALDDSFGQYGVWGIVKEAYRRGNLCIALTRFVPRGDRFDQLRKIVLDLKNMEKVKVVFLWLYGQYAQLFMDEAVKQGVKGKTWIFADGNPPAEPFYSDARFVDILNGSFGILTRAQHSEPFQRYLANLAKINFNGSTQPLWKEYLNYAEKENKSVDLSSFPNGSHFAISPYISSTIDAVYAFAHALHNMYECKDPGGLHEAGKCPTRQSKIKREDMHVYLKNVSFQGLSGTVQFDKNGDPFEARYSIVNFKSSGTGFAQVYVGWWARQASPRLHLDVPMITWNDPNGLNSVPVSVCSHDCNPGERRVNRSPCCWECVSCPFGTISSHGISTNCSECSERQKPNENRTSCVDLPLNSLKWSNIAVITVTLIATIGLVLTVLCLVVFIRHRNSPTVKASNKELSFLLLFVVASCFVLAFLHLLIPTDVLCCTINFWRNTVYMLCVSILLLKSRKIIKVFRFQGPLVESRNSMLKKTKKNLIFKGQRLYLFLLMLVQIILNVIWIIFDPPSAEVIVRRLQYVLVVCKPFSSGSGLAVSVIIITTFLFISSACIYYAFIGRRIPDCFNEARYIGFSMYVVLICSAADYSVEFGLEEWYMGLIGSATTLVSSLALIGCIFGPKIYVILFSPEQNTREAISMEIAKYAHGQSTSGAISGKAVVVTETITEAST